MIEAQHDALTLAVPAWPFAMFGPSVGLLAAATLTLWMLAPQMVRERLASAVALGGVAMLVGLALWVVGPLAFAMTAPADAPWAALVFGSTVWVALLGVPASVLLAASVTRLALCEAFTTRLGLLLLPWVVGLLGTAPGLAVLAAAHTADEGAALRIEVAPRVHLGAAAEARVQTPEDPRWVVDAPAPEVPDRVGSHTLTARAVRWPLMMWTEARVTVGEERGMVHLPLRAGNRWVYVPERDSGAPARFLWDTRGVRRVEREHERQRTLEIGEPVDRGGLRVFPFTVTDTDPGIDAVHAELYAFNGKVYLISDGGEHVEALALTARDGPGLGSEVTTCATPLFPGLSCSCAVRPGGLVNLPPGPLRCSTSRGGGLRELLRVTTLAVSAFAIDLGGRAEQRWVLVDVAPGPDGAPAVSPEPVPSPDPSLEALRDRLEGVSFDRDRLARLRREAPPGPLSVDAAAMLVQTFTFDDGRAEAVVLLAPRLDAGAPVDLLIEGALTFRHNKDALRARLSLP